MVCVTSRETNWAGSVTYGAERFHRPGTVEEMARIVARSQRAHALGTRHSFSLVADTSGDLIDVTGLPSTIDLDSERRQVRVSGGTTYGEVAAYLHKHGLALPNLGSLPHISVAGACATGTHGSGDRNGCLATAVSAIELMTADGDVVDIGADSGHLAGAVLSLGALGIAIAHTLDVRPTYDVTQHVYEHLPLADLTADLDGAFAAAYSVSLFTRWRGDVIDQVWLKQVTTEEAPGPRVAGRTPGRWPASPRPRHARHTLHTAR